MSDSAKANPSALFIARPVATSLFMVAIALAGLVAVLGLPLSALPEVDYPVIEVTTLYPGASPDVMGETVTAPLEAQLSQTSGLESMRSTSSTGASVITMQFRLAESLDVASQDVQAAINAASALLPADLPSPPTYAKVNPADAPVVSLAFTSRLRPIHEVQDIVDREVAATLAQIPGVGLVSLAGGERPAIRIRADPASLAARGIALETLRGAIANANVNGAKGSFDGPTRSWILAANDQLKTPGDYARQIIASPGGSPVRLGDVAQVREGPENARLGGWVDGAPAIILDIRRQPGANVVATSDSIAKALAPLKAALPADIHVRQLADRTQGIRASVHDVEVELLLAVLLVMAAIFLFLGDLRATLIASVAVPLSILGTFAAMHLLGYSLNNLTLMALTIASGFVVDDAIVVIENIARHREQGASPLAAAFRGSSEIGFTVISLTVSLIAVLIPLLFMGDVVGRLFREFAVTLAVTILVSAVVALTLTPMLCGRWLGGEPREGSLPARIARYCEDRFERLAHGYGQALEWVLARSTATWIVFGASLVLTAALFVAIPKGLFPEQDTGQIEAVFAGDEGSSFAAMAGIEHRLAQALLADPAVAHVSASLGIDGRNAASNEGRMAIALKPKGRRPALGDVLASLRRRGARVPGVALHLRPVEDLTIDTDAGPSPYRFSLEGADQPVLDDWARRLAQRLAKEPGLSGLVTDVHDGGKGLRIEIDRDAASRLGITAATIDAALYDAFGQRIVSTSFTQSNQYRVILEAPPRDVTGPASLALIHVPTSEGGEVPLTSVARLVETPARLAINRTDRFPSVTIGFGLSDGKSLGHGVATIERVEKEIGLPAGISTHFLGASQAFRAALAGEGWLILAAVIVVYIVLGVLYESYLHPLTILSTLPSAGVGALLALICTGRDFGVVGVIGIVLLIGIVKKNAILMIDFALAAEREQGLPPHEAIRHAATARFRPIMMTTFAALMAAVPMILGTGTGSELRQPLGIAIAGGLVVSQALTLFTTPVIFLGIERLKARISRALPDGSQVAA